MESCKKRYIFIEDRDLETGHGWRDFILNESGRLAISKYSSIKNGHIRFHLEFKEGDDWHLALSHEIYPNISYAWICEEDYFVKNKCIDDTFREVELVNSTFKGINTMEGHFEFDLTPGEMRDYLISLGFKEVSFSKV